MAVTDTSYTARFELPDLIERGKANTITCRTYRSGAVSTPTAAGSTVSVYDASNTAVVNAAAVTVSTHAQYAITAATLTDRALEMGWRVEWSLVMPDGLTHVFRTEAALVRGRLYPAISDVDIARRVSALDTARADVITGAANHQDKIDEAWIDLQWRLINKGNRPNLVMSPAALREPHLYLTLALIFSDLAARGDADYAHQADQYRHAFEAAWSRVAFEYDADDDGQADSNRRRAASPVTWLCGGRSQTWGPW